MNQQQQQGGSNNEQQVLSPAASEEPSRQQPHTTDLAPNLVDPMDVDEEYLYKITSKHSSDDHSIGGSSISEISGPKSPNELVMMVDDHQHQTKMMKPPPIPQPSTSIPKSHLSRADSRNSTDSSFGRQSSQTSDYGWFEDVHISTEHGGNTPILKRSKQDIGKTMEASNIPLVMMDQAAAASTDTPKKDGLSLLPHLTLAGDSNDEMQQVLLDPPLDLETGKLIVYVRTLVNFDTSRLGGTGHNGVAERTSKRSNAFFFSRCSCCCCCCCCGGVYTNLQPKDVNTAAPLHCCCRCQSTTP